METSRRVSTQTIHVQEDNFSKSNNNLGNQRSPQKESRAKKLLGSFIACCSQFNARKSFDVINRSLFIRRTALFDSFNTMS
jgi:hypothetical protein